MSSSLRRGDWIGRLPSIGNRRHEFCDGKVLLVDEVTNSFSVVYS